MTIDRQIEEIRRGITEVYSEQELRARLALGRPLRVKLGVDPTAPDIHLGHTVPLTKLRRFQDLGHVAVLIIGDFTARVGDPSGRSATRPQLSAEEIEHNARTYTDQVFKILDPAATEVRRNSEWFQPMPFSDVIGLASKITVARMLERDDFSKRYRGGAPIGLHEFLYPLMQAYDSVVVRSDVELGGTDQTFNLLLGRDLQRDAGMPGQIALVLPLLEGRDGINKMSKSLGNHIGISEDPHEMYGKVMSISDALMVKYYELLSDAPADEVERIRSGQRHPMEAKQALALEMVSRFHGAVAGDEARERFRSRFQARENVDPIQFQSGLAAGESVAVVDLLKALGFAKSAGEARRLVTQGGVRVDGRQVDLTCRFQIGSDRLIAVGRRRLAEVIPKG